MVVKLLVIEGGLSFTLPRSSEIAAILQQATAKGRKVVTTRHQTAEERLSMLMPFVDPGDCCLTSDLTLKNLFVLAENSAEEAFKKLKADYKVKSEEVLILVNAATEVTQELHRALQGRIFSYVPNKADQRGCAAITSANELAQKLGLNPQAYASLSRFSARYQQGDS